MAAASPYIMDVTTAGFTADVIDRSKTVPVLVDFWATWCGPCRALGPILEKLAVEYDGGFMLAKVDTDREQALAQQFQIRSIPTVTLFRDGKSVAGFPGALPEGQIRRFLDQHGVSLGGSAAPWSEDPEERVAQIRAALSEHPEREPLKLELAEALIATRAFEEAAPLLEAFSAHLYGDTRALRARAHVALHRMQLDDDFLAAAPGIRAVLDGDPDTGIDQLIDALREQKHDERSPAKAALVEITHLLTNEEQVRTVRRRMASVLF